MSHTTHLIDDIDACLPQTQCTRCGYPDCRSYANAIANEEAEINQCPPGGEVTIRLLADLLDVEEKKLNEDVHGKHLPRREAKIIEDLCIGCAACITACPVDAIIGAHKQMHTVISDDCTGCELCIPPCPLDCIVMEVPNTEHDLESSKHSQWSEYGYRRDDATLSRLRHEKRQARLSRTSVKKQSVVNARKMSNEDRQNTVNDIIKNISPVAKCNEKK